MLIPETPSQVEEMLMSRYHVLLQTWRVNGGQTKYSGHTCLFTHDNGRLIERLPATVTELDVIVIRPKTLAGATEPSNYSRRPEFQVKRSRVLANLLALQRFHPDHQKVPIDREALDALPEDGTVFGQLRSITVEDEEGTEVPARDLGPVVEEDVEVDGFVEAVIPNLGAVSHQMDETRNVLRGIAGRAEGPRNLDNTSQPPPILTAPPFLPTPVNEHDKSNKFLIKAFPFLFPTGEADLNEPREYNIRESDYFRHLLRYKDGRFAQHPRFR